MCWASMFGSKAQRQLWSTCSQHRAFAQFNWMCAKCCFERFDRGWPRLRHSTGSHSHATVLSRCSPRLISGSLSVLLAMTQAALALARVALWVSQVRHCNWRWTWRASGRSCAWLARLKAQCSFRSLESCRTAQGLSWKYARPSWHTWVSMNTVYTPWGNLPHPVLTKSQRWTVSISVGCLWSPEAFKPVHFGSWVGRLAPGTCQSFTHSMVSSSVSIVQTHHPLPDRCARLAPLPSRPSTRKGTLCFPSLLRNA